MTKIWAHRGASGYAPENTMESFALANQMNADGFELDVHLTCDGHVVVTHDDNVIRVTGHDGFVGEMTLQALRALDFSAGMPNYTNVRIPTLEDVLHFMRSNQMELNIEIKWSVLPYPGLEEKTVALVKAYGMQERVIYSSFNHYALLAVRKVCPDARIGLLYADGIVSPEKYALTLGANALHPHYLTLEIPTVLAGIKESGIKLHPWTVNTEQEITKVLAYQPDALITNYPDVARALRDNA